VLDNECQLREIGLPEFAQYNKDGTVLALIKVVEDIEQAKSLSKYEMSGLRRGNFFRAISNTMKLL
jgi:hypothetical protein